MVEAIRQGDIPGVQLRCRQELAVDTGEAWRWLTEGERLAQWVAEEARVQTEAGEPRVVELSGRDEEGAPRRERGESREVLPGRRWRLAFQRLEAGWPVATRLTLELTARPQGCEVSVLQQGFEHLPLSDCLTIWEAYRRRWRRDLARLADASAPRH